MSELKMKPSAWQSSVDPVVVTTDPDTAKHMTAPIPLYCITELREKVLELCGIVENYTDIPLTKQIREMMGEA